MKIESLKGLNRRVTGNWYIRNNTMYIEIRKVGKGILGIPETFYKYISERKIYNMLGDNE